MRLCRLPVGIVRMRRPIGIGLAYRLPRSRVGALRHRHHRDAILDRTYADTKIAADAFVVLDLKPSYAVDHRRDRLMRGVFAGDMAPATFDAELLIDVRLGHVIEVQKLPIGDVWH